jgi:hypothetical protein
VNGTACPILSCQFGTMFTDPAAPQIVWMLKGKREFRLGTEQRVCGPGDVMVNPGGSEKHEAWFHKD